VGKLCTRQWRNSRRRRFVRLITWTDDGRDQPLQGQYAENRREWSAVTYRGRRGDTHTNARRTVLHLLHCFPVQTRAKHNATTVRVIRTREKWSVVGKSAPLQRGCADRAQGCNRLYKHNCFRRYVFIIHAALGHATMHCTQNATSNKRIGCRAATTERTLVAG